MPRTYKYSDILNIVAKSFPSAVSEQYDATACNMATNLIHHRWDWRESIKELPPFYLIPGEQDYRAPFVQIPSDFHGLRQINRCRIVDGAVQKAEMRNQRFLSSTHIKNLPGYMWYEPAHSCFRVFPRPYEGLCAPTWFIEGTYKSNPTHVTKATLDTLLPTDDKHFGVWVPVLKYAFMEASGDQRAGQINYVNGTSQISGQLASALRAIDDMAGIEGINDGEVTVSPSEGLIQTTSGISPYDSYGLVF